MGDLARVLDEGQLISKLVDEWKEEEHPRRDDGKFGEGSVEMKEESPADQFKSFVSGLHEKYGSDIWGGKMSNEEFDTYQELEDKVKEEAIERERQETVASAKKKVEESKQEKRESGLDDSPTEDISPSKASQYKEADIIPKGWYVHGRHGRDDLNTGHVIQMTRNWDTATNYAGEKGSEWMVKRPSSAKTFDARDEEECKKLGKKMFRQYKKGELPSGMESLAEDLLRNADGDQEKAIETFAADMNPEKIVDSAGFWDTSGDEINWFYETTGKTFVVTNDGAVMVPGDEEIKTVRVEKEEEVVDQGKVFSDFIGKFVKDEMPENRTEGLVHVFDDGQLLEQMAGFVRTAMSALAPGLDKTLVGEVDFLGDHVKVFTANGENVRTPRESGGLGMIQFTMGGNFYAPGYTPLCAEDEVVLHNLLSPDDFMATLIHELVERYMMKTFRLDYDTAHEGFANPVEQLARHTMKAPGWSWA